MQVEAVTIDPQKTTVTFEVLLRSTTSLSFAFAWKGGRREVLGERLGSLGHRLLSGGDGGGAQKLWHLQGGSSHHGIKHQSSERMNESCQIILGQIFPVLCFCNCYWSSYLIQFACLGGTSYFILCLGGMSRGRRQVLLVLSVRGNRSALCLPMQGRARYESHFQVAV